MRGCPTAAATRLAACTIWCRRAVGKVDELATSSKNIGEQTENWQGVDVGISARLRNGLTLQGGTSTGRRLSDACALKAAMPEQGQGSRGATTSIAGGVAH